MKKFINEVDNILSESLIGFGKAHSDIINVNLSPDFISRRNKSNKDKVSLLTQWIFNISYLFALAFLKISELIKL